MNIRNIFAAALCGALALPAIAQDQREDADEQTQANAQQETQASSDEELEEDRGEEVLCRRERATGSLTRVRRVCMTRNEWNGVADRTRDAHNDTTRGAAGGVACRMDAMGGC